MSLPLTHSPSGLKLAQACPRKWADQYVNGNRSQEPSEATTFGGMVHNSLEHWAHGGQLYNAPIPEKLRKEIEKLRLVLITKLTPKVGPVQAQINAAAKIQEMIADAPVRALTAIQHLPARGTVQLLPEAAFTLDIARYHAFTGEPWRVSPNSSRDLVAVYPTGLWELYDYKTTSDFKWALTCAQLSDDIQWLIYGLATLDQAFWAGGPRQDRITGQWIYIASKGRPQSRVVTAAAGRDELAAGLAPWFRLADTLTGHLTAANRGRKFDLADYPPAATVGVCSAYGRMCHLSATVGGPCEGPPNALPFSSDHYRLPVIQPETRTQDTMHTPEQVPVNLANRLQEAAAALPMRPTEVAVHMAPAAPAPGYFYAHPDGNSYPVFGSPGQLAKYQNGVAVTDAAGRYLDVLGNCVTDGAHQATVAPPQAPAPVAGPATPPATQATAYVPSATPPAVPAVPPTATVNTAPPGPLPVDSAPYTPPPAEPPKPAVTGKGKPRKGKAETEESYQARLAAYNAGLGGPAVITASVIGEATIAAADKVEAPKPFGSVAVLLDDLRKAARAVTEAGYTVEVKVVL